MWTLYFSQFFPSFFIVFHRICLRLKVRDLDFIIVLWLIDGKLNELVTFPWMKKITMLFGPQFVRQSAGNHILGLWNFKIFWGSMPPDPPRKRRLVYTVGNSIRTHWLLVFLLKPLRGPRDIVYSGNMAHLESKRRTFQGSFGHMILWESFWDWNSLRCDLVHSGRLNLANVWIPYWTCNADIFHKPQVWLWSKK